MLFDANATFDIQVVVQGPQLWLRGNWRCVREIESHETSYVFARERITPAAIEVIITVVYTIAWVSVLPPSAVGSLGTLQVGSLGISQVS